MSIQPVGSKSFLSTASSWVASPFVRTYNFGTGAVGAIYNGLKNRMVSPAAADARIAKVAKTLQPVEVDSDEILREMGRKIDRFKRPAVEDVPVDWRANTDKLLQSVIDKASMLTIVTMMDDKIDNSLAIEIVNEASSTNRSVYSVFKEKNGAKLTLGARFTYFLFYYLGIIPNTLDTFMKSVLGELRSELVQKEGGKNLTSLLDRMLGHTSSFLDIYLKAVHDYRDGVDLKGERDTHIASNLAKLHGKPLEQICEEFAKTAVREFLPHVSFFKRWTESSSQIVRVISRVLTYPVDKLLNYILRQKLEEKIPSILQDVVTAGTDAAQQKNLPFAISITQGISDQLNKFKNHLALQGNEPAASAKEVPGAKKLPDVVKKFMSVLELEPYKTREELQDYEKSKSSANVTNLIKPYIIQNIQESIIDASKLLFSFAADPAHTEETFSKLLELSDSYFDSKPPSTPEERQKLQNQFDEMQQEMRREAKEVFQTVIRKSVKERIQGLPETEIEKNAALFGAHQIERTAATTTKLKEQADAMSQKLSKAFAIQSAAPVLEKLQSSLEEIEKKAPHALTAPLLRLKEELERHRGSSMLSWLNVRLIQISLATFKSSLVERQKKLDPTLFKDLEKQLTGMQALLNNATQKPTEALSIEGELENMIEVINTFRNQAYLEDIRSFPKEYQLGIAAALNPIYIDLDQLINLSSTARDLQTKQLREQQLSVEFGRAAEILTQCGQLFVEKKNQEISLQFSEALRSLAKVRSLSDKNDANAVQFDSHLTNLNKTFETHQEEELILQNLGQLGEKGGLLSQLAKAVHARATNTPNHFRWKDASAKIAILTRALPESERKRLQEAIDSVLATKTVTDLQPAWENLRQGMQVLFSSHQQQRNAIAARFTEQLRTATAWMKQSETQLAESVAEAQQNLLFSAENTLTRIAELREKSDKIQVKKVENIDSKFFNAVGGQGAVIGGIAGAGLGLALTAAAGPMAPPLFGAAAGAAHAMQNGASPVGRAVLGGALAGAVSALPGVGPYIAPAITSLLGVSGMFAGKQAKQMASEFASDQLVYPEVEKVFFSLYDFVLQSHVWKWTVVDTLNTVNEAYKPAPVAKK